MNTDGNGDPTAGAGATAYAAAYPRRVAAASGRMGCPSGTCAGYELRANLDFDSDGDGDVDANDHGGAYWNSGTGWAPIAADLPPNTRFATTLKGNGYTINNLFINRTTNNNNLGLFAAVGNGGRIESLGVTNASVSTGNGNYNGILAGNNYGEIVACYTTGSITSRNFVGGLVGFSNAVANTTATITSSYSTASVTAHSASQNVGGLVGRVNQGVGATSTIVNSYSTGAVSSGGGGLVGSNNNGSATASYWDTVSSGRSSSALGTGKTPRQLQTVTGYTSGSIYADWNANLDGVSGNDDPWDFGNNMQYPMLKYDGMSTDPQGGQAMGIPDNWNAPITGERVGVCLTPADQSSRATVTVSGSSVRVPWSWERSADGVAWTAIPGTGDGSSLPTYEYSPVAADVGMYIRAKVELADGSVAYTRVLGGRVSATTTADEGAEIPFVRGHAAPQVDAEIVAANPLPTGAKDARVGWQRCPSTTTAPHSDCTAILAEPGHWWIRYTPTADDVGFYLRMYAYYETGDGTWTRRVTPITGAVVASQ